LREVAGPPLFILRILVEDTVPAARGPPPARAFGFAVSRLGGILRGDSPTRKGAAMPRVHAAEVECVAGEDLSEADAFAVVSLRDPARPATRADVEEAARRLLESCRDRPGAEAPAARLFIVRQGGRIAAKAMTFAREIGTSRGELTVMALADVRVAEGLRGRGLGRAVVGAAFGRVDRGAFPASLFQTSRRVRPFYEKLGACVATNRFVNSLAEDPSADAFRDKLVMRYPAAFDWPEGQIDLRGPGY
jgi:GNAT superfamily N-acetyltransferase